MKSKVIYNGQRTLRKIKKHSKKSSENTTEEMRNLINDSETNQPINGVQNTSNKIVGLLGRPGAAPPTQSFHNSMEMSQSLAPPSALEQGMELGLSSKDNQSSMGSFMGNQPNMNSLMGNQMSSFMGNQPNMNSLMGNQPNMNSLMGNQPNMSSFMGNQPNMNSLMGNQMSSFLGQNADHASPFLPPQNHNQMSSFITPQKHMNSQMGLDNKIQINPF